MGPNTRFNDKLVAQEKGRLGENQSGVHTR